jgi:hypothetical protein
MSKVKIRPFNVIDNTELPVMTVDRIPVNGDPLEIDKEMYYACETRITDSGGIRKIDVIPLVVKNPSRVANIQDYLQCLSVAHRRVQFRKKNNICDFNDCDEMIIS